MSTLYVETVPVPISDDNLTGSRTDPLALVAGTATETPIPDSHKDLIDGPYWAALTTILPDDPPQTTPVWCNRAGDYVLIHTMRGFRNANNMRTDPHVTVLVYDSRDPSRTIEVCGLVVEMTEA